MSGAKKSREVRDGLLANLSACKYSLVREAAERLGYQVVEDEPDLWDLFWSDLSVSSDRVQRLLPFQRLNHFPGMLEICRKAALSRHMSRMASRLPSEYGFYPTSLVLPDQLDELMAALRRNKTRADAAAAAGGAAAGAGAMGAGGGDAASGAAAAAAAGISTFILKPSAGTQGRGIALVQYPNQLAEAGDVGSCVAQAYVASPLLLDGFKFDLRVYALVASVDPLRIHLYDEGLARLATEPYKPPCPSNLRAATMHLTNYAINKGAAGFVSADAAPAGGGSKRLMSAVLSQLALQYGTTQEALLGSIADVVTKTVMAVQPLLAHTYHTSLSTTAAAACPTACGCPSLDHMSPGSADPTGPCGCPPSLCFELLGFDILFDTSLQPWLLEVNHSPSFAGDSRLDRAVKGDMLARAMLMLGQQPWARREYLEAEARAQSERLYSASSPSYSTAQCSFLSQAQSGRRAISALPHSRQLQATAAALEAITANSAALLAGGQVWGGGGGGAGGATASGSSSGCSRPASGNASDSRAQPFYNSGCSGGGGAGAGTAAAVAAAAHRSLSLNGGSLGLQGEGGGGVVDCGSHRGFLLVFPTAKDSDRKRYSRILQTAADLFPQQRCQCPYCSRRREVSLLAMSGQQLGLAARPPSAVSSGLSGHLPVRAGTANLRPRRTGSANPAGQRPRPAAGEDCGGSDTDGGAPAGPEGRAFGGSAGAGGGSRPPSSSSSSVRGGPRGKPPRPGCDARASCFRADGHGSRSSGAGPWAQVTGASQARAAPPPSKLPYPAPPSMASVLVASSSHGYSHGYSYSHSYNGSSNSNSCNNARLALPQRHASAFALGGGAAGPAGGAGAGGICHLLLSEHSLPGEASCGGGDISGPLSHRSWHEGASGLVTEPSDSSLHHHHQHGTSDRHAQHEQGRLAVDNCRGGGAGCGGGSAGGPAGNGSGLFLETPDPVASAPPAAESLQPLSDQYSLAAAGQLLPDHHHHHEGPARAVHIPIALRPLSHSQHHPHGRSASGHRQQVPAAPVRPRPDTHAATVVAASDVAGAPPQLHARRPPQQQHWDTPAGGPSLQATGGGGGEVACGGSGGTAAAPCPGRAGDGSCSGAAGGGSSGRSLSSRAGGGGSGPPKASYHHPTSQQPQQAHGTPGGGVVKLGSAGRPRGNGAAAGFPAKSRRPASRDGGRRGGGRGATYTSAVRPAPRRMGGGSGDRASDDEDDDGCGYYEKDSSGGDPLRRSYSCSELEAAFRGAAATGMAAVRGFGGPNVTVAYGSLLDNARPWEAAAAAAPSLQQRADPSDSTQLGGPGGGGGSAAGAGAGLRPMPRVAYLGGKRGAAGGAAPREMSAADLELLMVRVRTASVLSNRYISSSSYVSYLQTATAPR